MADPRIIDITLDQQSIIWVGGLDANTRLIVTGQDYIKDGDAVDATKVEDRVPAEPAA